MLRLVNNLDPVLLAGFFAGGGLVTVVTYRMIFEVNRHPDKAERWEYLRVWWPGDVVRLWKQHTALYRHSVTRELLVAGWCLVLWCMVFLMTTQGV